MLFSSWKKKIERLFDKVDQDLTEEIRQVLHENDVPASVIIEVLETITKNGPPTGRAEFSAALKESLMAFVEDYSNQKLKFSPPQCIILVGINGVGKTTTAARLAYLLNDKKFKVVLGAADTFRAGAAEQLKEWGKSLNLEVVSGAYGADPASVAFQTWQKAKEQGAIAIIDTAGRMHTKSPLMDQLSKIQRVLEKDPSPHGNIKLLVLDGNIGQNSVIQAKEFAVAIDLDGVILTKMDGAAKAGFILQVMKEIKKPVFYIGVGEKPQDLIEFNVETFVSQLL